MANKEIENYLSVDYIYIPYEKNMKINIKDKEYIYKNTLLLSGERNVYSSVSGTILGATKIHDKKYIVLENDFKDKLAVRSGAKKNINNYTKEEFIDLINKYFHISDFDETSKVLIVSGIDSYYEETIYGTLLENFTTPILETIDAIIEIMNIKKCFLAISSKNTESIDILVNNLGTYPKIDLKILNNNLYMGNKEILIDKLTNYKNKNYNVLFLNIKDILNIYTILKFKRSATETYILLTGNLIDFSKVIRVKLGTNLADLLKEYNIKETENIIVNGLLNGTLLKDRNYIIDNNVRSIFINTCTKFKVNECINCGACLEICPIHINPKYMYHNNDKKADYYKNKCINCGLCSYICPSKISLNRDVVKNDKE